MKKLISTLTTLILIITLTACSGGQDETQISEIASAVDSAVTSLVTGDTQAETSSSVTDAASIPDLLAENQEVHEDSDDYTWDSASVIPIVLNGTSIVAEHPGITVDGSSAAITTPGTYSLSGSLTDGQILVNSEEEGLVRLILNGVDLHSSTSAPIYVIAADEVMLVLAEGTKNFVSDGAAWSAT